MEARAAMRLTKAGQAAVNECKAEIRGLKAALKKSNSEKRDSDRANARKDKTIVRLKGTVADLRSELAKANRKLRYHEGPSAPGVKNRADRKRDGKARKREADEAAAREGGEKRKPGAQPGHKAHRRVYRPTRRVVVDEGGDRACKDKECDGKRAITGYASRIMVERKPRPAPEVIEAHCPKSECEKCGRKWTATSGTAVPLHKFAPQEGEPAPAEAGGPGAAEVVGEGQPPRPTDAAGPEAGEEAAARKQAPSGRPAPAATATATAYRADKEVDWSRVNDIPDDPNEPFHIMLARKGESGPNLISDAVMNWGHRIPYKKSQAALKEGGASMSVGAICNAIANSGTALMPTWMDIRDLLRHAKMLHIDKTMYRVSGKRWSLWVFYDPQNKNVAYLLTPKGDSAAIDEVLGDWAGTVICDGAQVFARYRKKQRCWAHVLRESHYIQRNNPKNRRVEYVDRRLGEIFLAAKAFKGSAKERMKKRYELARRVRELADEYGGDAALREFAVTLQNAAFDLFLFVVDPEVAPTNNPAEQLLREPVIVRKIRGSLRSERSATVMCALLSCMTTWERHGLNPIIELKKLICAPA